MSLRAQVSQKVVKKYKPDMHLLDHDPVYGTLYGGTSPGYIEHPFYS